MIILNLDWREIIWWLQGGMAGSHLRWNVYEDMVNKVWPQCTEQERRNIWLIMRRDCGTYWRPNEWRELDLANAHGEGEWKPEDKIFDSTAWTYFRQVLSRFDPENQFAVTMYVHNQDELDDVLRFTPASTVIECPKIPKTKKGLGWKSGTATVKVRAYRWQDEYRIDWKRRCDEGRIMNIEHLTIPDDGTI